MEYMVLKVLLLKSECYFRRKFYGERTDIATCHPCAIICCRIFLINQFRPRDAALSTGLVQEVYHSSA